MGPSYGGSRRICRRACWVRSASSARGFWRSRAAAATRTHLLRLDGVAPPLRLRRSRRPSQTSRTTSDARVSSRWPEAASSLRGTVDVRAGAARTCCSTRTPTRLTRTIATSSTALHWIHADCHPSRRIWQSTSSSSSCRNSRMRASQQLLLNCL